jgi:hypothetical protein
MSRPMPAYPRPGRRPVVSLRLSMEARARLLALRDHLRNHPIGAVPDRGITLASVLETAVLEGLATMEARAWS